MIYKAIENKKYIAVCVLVVMAIFTLFSIGAYAITEGGIVEGNEVMPPNNILFSNVTTGVKANPDNVQVFACCAYDGSFSGVLFATTNSNTSRLQIKNVYGERYFSDGIDTITYNGNTIYINHMNLEGGARSGNNFTYARFNSSWLPTNTLAENFYEYVINGGSESSSGNAMNYMLPPGNIAIIETDRSYSYINFSTTMPLQSTSFSHNPWPNTTQRIGYYNTLPQSISPNSMGNTIEWERSGNTTLFNITTSAKYNPSVVSTFKYVIIANPYYYPANDMEDSQYTNGAINISMDGVVNITVKSLTATVNTQTGAVEDNYNGEEWTGEIDETTNDIIWTDGNGDNNAPTSGGNLSDPSITGFQSWLKGILNNIVNIFQPAHDAINTLSGAVSNFASWMYALYVWLPSPILSLLTSAISLAIVIGIIKVFI